MAGLSSQPLLAVPAFGLDGALFVASRDARLEERPLARVQCDVAGVGPLHQLVQLCAAQEVTVVLSRRGPRRRRGGDAALPTDVVSSLLDPVLQAGPHDEERLVGDLDGRATCNRIPIERQESMGTERVEDLVDVRATEGVELESQHAPTRHLRTIAQRD